MGLRIGWRLKGKGDSKEYNLILDGNSASGGELSGWCAAL